MAENKTKPTDAIPNPSLERTRSGSEPCPRCPEAWRKRVVLAALSGASVWPLSYVLNWLETEGEWWHYTLIGGTFGALVLVPFLPANRQRMVPVIVLVLGSILIYGLVVEFAMDSYGPLNLDNDVSIVVSALIGALLVGGLAKFVVPLQTSAWFWVAVTIAGLFGGFLFSLVWDNETLFTAGYVGWQVAVCLALFKGGATSNSSARR